MISYDDRKNFLVQQYHEVAEQYRLHNRQFWQMPSISIALISAIIGVSYGYITDLTARTALLFIGLNMALVIAIVLVKLRFSLIGIVLTLEKIENELMIEHVQWTTERGPFKPRSWWERRRAFNWFIGLQFIMVAVLGFLFLSSLITLVQANWY